MRLVRPTPSRRPTMPMLPDFPSPPSCPSFQAGGADGLPPSPLGVPVDDGPLPPPPSVEHPPRHEGEGAPAGLGTTTVLPSAFGSIYAGEDFRALVAVHARGGGGGGHLRDRWRPVRVGGGSGGDSGGSGGGGGGSGGGAIERVCATVVDIGVHVLVCEAREASSGAHLKQTFRFNVLPPLRVAVHVEAYVPTGRGVVPLRGRGAVVALPPPGGILAGGGDSGGGPANAAAATTVPTRHLVQVSVTNVMPLPLYLSAAAIVVADHASMTATLLTPVGTRGTGAAAAAAVAAGSATPPLHPPSPGSPTGSVSAPTSPTSPSGLDTSGDVRSGRLSAAALERALPPRRGLSPADTMALFFLVTSPPGPRLTSALGTLSLRWRSGAGEDGHLPAAAAVEAPPPPPRPAGLALDVAVVAVPAAVPPHTPFAARVRVTNAGTEAVRRVYVQVRRDRGSGGVVGVGASGVSVGELPVGGGVEVDVVMMVLGVPGGGRGREREGEATLDGVRAVEGRGRGWDAPPVKQGMRQPEYLCAGTAFLTPLPSPPPPPPPPAQRVTPSNASTSTGAPSTAARSSPPPDRLAAVTVAPPRVVAVAAAHVAAPHRFRSYYPQAWMDHLSDGVVTHTLAAFPVSAGGADGAAAGAAGRGYGRSTHAASLAAGDVRVEAAAAFRHVSLDLAAFVLDADQVAALTRSVAVLPLGVAAKGDRVVAVGGAMADPATVRASVDGTTDAGDGDGDGSGGDGDGGSEDGSIPLQLPRGVPGTVARIDPGRSLVRTATGMTVLGMCGGPVLAAGGGGGGGQGGEAGSGGSWPPPCVGLLEALVPPDGGTWRGHSVVVPAVEIAAFLEDVAAEVARGAA
ncbi:hypothetical protein MMPV_000984 [Pyropia vietnamensis]